MNDLHNKTKHSVEKSADRATSLLDEASDKFTGLVEDAKDKGQELIEQAKGRGVELIDDAQERGQDAWKDLKKWVQKNPGTALGWSIAAGAILYAVFTRKED